MSIQNLEAQEQGDAHDDQAAIDGIISNDTLNGHNPLASPTNSSSSYSSDVKDLSANLTQTSVSGQPQDVNTSLTAVHDIPNPKLCGVCKEKEYKYKCSRCLLP
jgi:hypothetical protein